jgi:serine/threonine protein kinase/Tol biopolymer transport system component
VGSGGMGEVYRARDPKLNRVIAIKVLPETSAANPERRARFEREAQSIAALSHPNIVTIYSVEEADGLLFLTMEYVDGTPLSDQIGKGWPLARLLKVAIPLADAISAAHQKGITHRDLKPSNVMLSSEGRVKVLDFGLAKLMETSAREMALPGVPTETLTEEGRIVGTAAYMSPEQAEGKSVDNRSDVFSLGILLYEMATGERPFKGESRLSVLSAIVKDTPRSVTDLNPAIPREFARVVKLCLAKETERRYQTAVDVRNALEELRAELESGEVTIPTRPASLPAMPKPIWAAAVGTVVVLLIGTASLLVFKRDMWLTTFGAPRGAPAGELLGARFDVSPPFLAGSWPRISPDGRFIVFGASVDNHARLWIRPLDAAPGYPLANTTATETPFWSPDSRTLAFFEDGKLKTISRDGGDPLVLADALRPHGGDWSGNSILYAPADGIHRIASDGTGDTALTKVDPAKGDSQHVFPIFLPDGKRFLFVIRSNRPERRGLYVAPVAGGPPVRVREVAARTAYARGHLFFVRDGILMAEPFDAEALKTTGSVMPLVGHVKFGPGGDAAFDVSASGVLVYSTDSRHLTSRLVLYDRNGRQRRALTGDGPYRQPRFSPNGRQVAAEKLDATDDCCSTIWVYDVARDREATITTHTDDKNVSPVWSHDGSRIAFSHKVGGTYQIFQKLVDGTLPEKLLVFVPGDAVVEDWSSDGRYLAVAMEDSGLWVIPVNPKERAWIVRPAARRRIWQAEFSPDMRWLAYESQESGRSEVYVEPFPTSGARWLISTGGGAEPHWRGDGKELFFLRSDQMLMSVAVSGADWQHGAAMPLFKVAVPDLADGRDYSVSPNGDQFVVNTFVAGPELPPVKVVTNWPSLLKR